MAEKVPFPEGYKYGHLPHVEGKFWAWYPQPGPQSWAIMCGPIKDLTYGGSRGGGKTDYLLGDAMFRANDQGKHFRGLLLRRTLPELTEVISRSKEIYPLVGATWRESETTWTFPQGGTMRLRYLDNDQDADQYMGHSYTWLGVDEVGNFPSPAPIDKLWGVLRSAHGINCVRRMTCNPGGPGHAWVKKRYVSHGPFKAFFYQPQPELAPKLKIQAVFVPSRLEDNKILMESNPDYETALAAVGDSALYRAWRFGDWDVLAGTYYDIWDPNKHTEAAPAVPYYWPRWIGMDWGFTHPSAVYWAATDGQKNVVYRELVKGSLDPRLLAWEIAERNGRDKVDAFFLSPDAFAHRSSERTIASEMAAAFQEYADQMGTEPIPAPEPADNDRVGGAQLVYQLLRSGNLVISRDCERVIECLPGCVRDPKHPEDILKVEGDDPYEGLRYTMKSRQRGMREPREVRVARMVNPKSEEWIDPNLAAMRTRIANLKLGPDGPAAVRMGGGRSWQPPDSGRSSWDEFYAGA